MTNETAIMLVVLLFSGTFALCWWIITRDVPPEDDEPPHYEGLE